MATIFYVIRHGQSVANDLGIFLGQVDMDLTEIGRKQAALAAKFFKEQGICPDAIYASDLSRAYNTALATAELFRVPVVKDSRLREIFAGAWECVGFDQLLTRYPQSYGTWISDIGNAGCDDGESVKDVQNRFVYALKEIAEVNDGKTVFIFTHATPVRVFAAHCLGKNLGQVKDIPWATNASVTKAFYEKGRFTLLEYSRNDFMGELVTKLPANV